MFRLYDYECLDPDCAEVREYFVEVPHGEECPVLIQDECKSCGQAMTLERRLSLPAPYMGESVCNPQMHGGRFDTMGMRALPPLPDLPAGADGEAYKQMFQSKEYKKARHDRQLVKAENAGKQKRAAALKRGEVVNMKRDKVKGDPKFA